MVAAKYNLYIEQGSDFAKVFTYSDTSVNLSGYSARMKIKETINSPTAIADLSTATSGLTINVGARSITISLTSAQTAAMNFTQAVYDLELVSGGGVVSRLLSGTVTLSKEVTI